MNLNYSTPSSAPPSFSLTPAEHHRAPSEEKTTFFPIRHDGQREGVSCKEKTACSHLSQVTRSQSVASSSSAQAHFHLHFPAAELMTVTCARRLQSAAGAILPFMDSVSSE